MFLSKWILDDKGFIVFPLSSFVSLLLINDDKKDNLVPPVSNYLPFYLFDD